MKELTSKQFFTRFLLITTITIVLVIIASAIGTNTLFAAIITALLLMTTVFVLLFHMVIAVTDFFTELFKRKGKFDYFRLINVFFSVTVNVFFMFFYFSLLGSAFIQILF